MPARRAPQSLGELMVDGNRQRGRACRFQQSGQIRGFASKLLADGADLGRVALRLEAGDQGLQP